MQQHNITARGGPEQREGREADLCVISRGGISTEPQRQSIARMPAPPCVQQLACRGSQDGQHLLLACPSPS